MGNSSLGHTSFTQYLAHQQRHLLKRIPLECAAIAPHLAGSGIFTQEVLEYIDAYVRNGKMLRGTLLMLGYEMHAGTPSQSVHSAAIALELLQSFLLVHDDIIDRDTTRRGMLATHHYYQHKAAAHNIPHPAHYGISMAICYGDVLFALSQYLLHQAAAGIANSSLRQLLLRNYTLEVARVGVGQMEDFYYAHYQLEPPSESVLQLYRNKTGRYTVALPLQLGTYLAEKDQNIPHLARYGQEVGVIFQLQDDKIGVSPTKGKPLGSDILNKTRTYSRQLLREQGSSVQIAELTALEKRSPIRQSDIDSYNRLLQESGVGAQIEEYIDGCAQRALQALDALRDISPHYLSLLKDFLDFNRTRQH